MFRHRVSTFVASFTAVAVIAGGLMFADAARGEPADSSGQTAQEILQDGLDAISDRQTDLAQTLFEQLVLSYPESAEAAQATRELAKLGGPVAPAPAPSASSDTGPAAQAPADDPVPAAPQTREGPLSGSITALRMKFVSDVGDRVFFAENSATIGGRARAMIENQARWLKAHPAVAIKVIGRADDGGTPETARELSQKRATVVRDQLVAGGVAHERVTLESRGDKDPIALCRTFMCQAQNRLAETLLLAPAFKGAASEGDSEGDGETDSERGAAAAGLNPAATVAR